MCVSVGRPSLNKGVGDGGSQTIRPPPPDFRRPGVSNPEVGGGRGCCPSGGLCSHRAGGPSPGRGRFEGRDLDRVPRYRPPHPVRPRGKGRQRRRRSRGRHRPYGRSRVPPSLGPRPRVSPWGYRRPTNAKRTAASHNRRHFASAVYPVTMPARGLTCATTTRSSGRSAFAAPVSPVAFPASGRTYNVTAASTDLANFQNGVWNVTTPKSRLTLYDTARSSLSIPFRASVWPVFTPRKDPGLGSPGRRLGSLWHIPCGTSS